MSDSSWMKWWKSEEICQRCVYKDDDKIKIFVDELEKNQNNALFCIVTFYSMMR